MAAAFHENCELFGREYKTAEYIADYLYDLGLEVEKGVAKTSVVALLVGGQPGPVIGLREDIDALPVSERTDAPFMSTATGIYQGKEVVMHACGHDIHMAILMGGAEIVKSHLQSIFIRPFMDMKLFRSKNMDEQKKPVAGSKLTTGSIKYVFQLG